MVDWSPFGGNPVPGDPAAVKQLASSFHQQADDADKQNSLLKALKGDATGIWVGPAAEAFKPHLTDLPDKLDKFITSYREAGDALAAYAPKLATAQADALTALRKATAALTALHTAQAGQAKADHDAKAAAAKAKPGTPPPTVMTPDYTGQIQQANADLAAAHTLKDHAVTDAKNAAHDAISALQKASHDGIRNKHHHWWDTIVDVLTHPVQLLKVISLVANRLSAICGLLALVTCWIPGVGEFFEAASLVTGLIGFAADLTLAATGNGSWGDVLTDAVAVGTAGVGHILGEGAEAIRAADNGATMVKDGEAALKESASLKAEARNVLSANSGKMTRAQKVAVREEAAGLRAQAGELTKQGKALTSEGQKLVDEGSHALRTGTRESYDQAAGVVRRTGQRIGNKVAPGHVGPPELPENSPLQDYKDFMGNGADFKGAMKDFYGNGTPGVATYRNGQIAVSSYSTGVAMYASQKQGETFQNGTWKDKPAPIGEQMHDLLDNVTWGFAPHEASAGKE